MHTRVDMGSCERVVMGLESPAVSAQVTKHFFCTFIKTFNKDFLKKVMLTVCLSG